LSAVAQRLHRESKVELDVEVLDLSLRADVEQWLNEHRTSLDYDVLVNNAALGEADLFLGSDMNRMREAFEINFFTPVLFTGKILPGMLGKRKGAILNIVTSGARCALPLFSSYASSKGALWAWSEALGRELIGKGITVTTFLPPHMESVTQRRLGRKALAYYKFKQSEVKVAPINLVAQQAVEALSRGQSIVAPLSTKWKLALNAMVPGIITRQILKNWRKEE